MTRFLVLKPCAPPKSKDADSFESASSVMTVAGGFGGSGDDQSSLGDRGEHRWGEESGGGDKAEELGHFKTPKSGGAAWPTRV